MLIRVIRLCCANVNNLREKETKTARKRKLESKMMGRKRIGKKKLPGRMGLEICFGVLKI